MKNAKACLKCDHATIWRVDPLSFFDRESANFITPLPVGCRMVDHPNPGLLSRPTVRKVVGKFVVYVCAACGFSEMYATEIDELATLQRGEAGTQVTPAGDSAVD